MYDYSFQFLESRIAIGFVKSNFDRTIIATAIIGTVRKAPIDHHILDQKIREIIITVELILSLSHIILGSRKFPEIIWGMSIQIANRNDIEVASNWTKE